MADYYSLLARAAANLPKSSPPSARLAIYDRARAALVNQLRSLKPQLPDSDIAREESALDAAIARLETEFEAKREAAPTPLKPPTPSPAPPKSATPTPSPAPPKPSPPTPSPPPPKPATPTLSTSPPRPATPPPPRVETSAAPVVAPRAPTLGVAPPRVEPRLPPAPVAPPIAPRAPTLSAPLPNRAPIVAPAAAVEAAAAPAPKVSPYVPPKASEVAARGPVEPSPAPVVSADAEAQARPDNAPRIGSPTQGDFEGNEAARIDLEPPRPNAPTANAIERANPWPWIALAVVVGLVGSVAVAAFLLREKPQDLTVAETSDAPKPNPTAANGQKIAQRVGSAPTDSTPSPAPTQSPTPTPTDGASPAPTPSPSASSTSAQPSTQNTPMAIPVAARAAMLVAEGSDTQNPAVNLGSTVWSAVPANPGQPGSGGFKAEVDIPDLKMHASMVVRKNVDPGLPASHTIDFRASFEAGGPVKGIKDIGLPLMRRDDPPNADPLLGVHVKINDGYYLVGLNRAEADIAHNLDLIGTRGWFDFPMQLSDDRIAKLTFEKAAEGERVVSEAIAAWKQP